MTASRKTAARPALRLAAPIAAFVAFAALAGAAVAQTGTGGGAAGGTAAPGATTTGSAPGSTPQAPAGRRQPRPADIPAAAEKPPAEMQVEKLQEEGSRKLNICRGC